MAGALEGVRVLDLTQGAAGPYCTMILGDMGAEVIKVEPPGGDWGRSLGPPFEKGESAIFLSLNRNKRSLLLNFKDLDELNVARELARRVDVVVESFRPGVLAKFGLDYESLAADHARLVYCSISGFGSDGPLRDKPGVDGILQAISGFMSVTGNEGEIPVKAGVVVGDMTAGLMAAKSVTAALYARERNGAGQLVEVNLLNALLALQSTVLHMYLMSGELPKRMGSHAPYAVPNGAFETADGYIMVAANLEPKWKRFCQLVERPDWADHPRFGTNEGRVSHRAELMPLLEELFKSKTSAQWLELLESQDILCAPIQNYEEVLQMPQVLDNGMLAQMRHSLLGEIPGIGIPDRLQGTPGEIRYPPPLLGEHSEEILAEFGLEQAPRRKSG